MSGAGKEQDEQMERAIGRMLQVGVLLSAAVVLAGGLLLLNHAHAPAPEYSHFVQSAYGNVLVGLRTGPHARAEAVIDAGILLLVATPVIRVGFCIAGFARQKDWLYVAVSAGVLAILGYSLAFGGR